MISEFRVKSHYFSRNTKRHVSRIILSGLSRCHISVFLLSATILFEFSKTGARNVEVKFCVVENSSIFVGAQEMATDTKTLWMVCAVDIFTMSGFLPRPFKYVSKIEIRECSQQSFHHKTRACKRAGMLALERVRVAVERVRVAVAAAVASWCSFVLVLSYAGALACEPLLGSRNVLLKGWPQLSD